MEKILRIEEGSFKQSENSYGSYDGYLIITDEQTIKIGISDGQGCCESWGFLTSEDNLSDFIGAELHSVKLVDTALNTKCEPDLYEGGCMFVTLETSKGPLQFTAYNSHNGYYGHEAVLVSRQFNHEEII